MTNPLREFKREANAIAHHTQSGNEYRQSGKRFAAERRADSSFRPGRPANVAGANVGLSWYRARWYDELSRLMEAQDGAAAKTTGKAADVNSTKASKGDTIDGEGMGTVRPGDEGTFGDLKRQK